MTVCATVDRGTTCAASKRLRKRGALCPMRARVGEVCGVFVSSRERREMDHARRAAQRKLSAAYALAMRGAMPRR